MPDFAGFVGYAVFRVIPAVSGAIVGGFSYIILQKVAGGIIPPGPIMAGVSSAISVLVVPKIMGAYSPYRVGFGPPSAVPYTA